MVQHRKKFTNNQFRLMIEQRITPHMIEPSTWLVPSGTQPGVAYRVRVRRNTRDARRHEVCDLIEVVCDCPAGQHGQGCKHALAVIHEFNRDWSHFKSLGAARKEAA